MAPSVSAHTVISAISLTRHNPPSSRSSTMASGPVVTATTPHRTNAAYQVLIDSGPPTTFGSPTPTQPAKRKRDEQTQPIAWPALPSSGRPLQAPATPTGPRASFHDQPTPTAAAVLGEILTEVQRREASIHKILGLVAHSLDNITATCSGEERPIAKEITDHFASFLTTKLLRGKSGESPTAAKEPSGWASMRCPGGPEQPSQVPTRTHLAQENKTTARAEKEDIRLLARLPEEQLKWAKTVTNFALRKTLCDQTELSLIDVPNVFRTATGFAIHPRNKEIRQKLLAKERLINQCLRATKLELPTKWYNYVVPNCPTKLPNLFGEVMDVSSVIEDETVAQTGQRPVRIRPSRHESDSEINRKSWIISFSNEIPAFRLFGSSARSRLISNKRTITRHNPGCQGYHPDRFCARNTRCENCGIALNTENEHPQPCTNNAKCANCYGPAPANHDNCPAKPIRKSGQLQTLTKKELSTIRRAGQKLYDAKHKAKAINPRPEQPQSSDPFVTSSPNLRDTETAMEAMEAMETDTAEDTPSEGAQETPKEVAKDATSMLPQRSMRPRRSTGTNQYNYANRYSFLDNETEPSD